MDKKRIKVLGLGQNFSDLPPSYLDIISKSDVIVGGKRQLKVFSHLNSKKIVITPPIKKLISTLYSLKDRDVVVLADGDPLFYGIGERLVRELGRDIVEIYPNISVLQLACSKLGISPKDVAHVSLHGRKDIFPLFCEISWNRYVGVYTDNIHPPKKIAEIFMDREIFEFVFHVFEDLGTPNERIRSLSVVDASNTDFSKLNFIILERVKNREIEPHLGMEDDLFARDREQLTKKEIRILSIAQMKIREDSTIVDIGAGSGSVSIESLVMAKKGRLFAIEKDPHRTKIIKENRKKFGLYSLEIIEKSAENALEFIPVPDRIFIGGGLLKNPKLLELSYEKLAYGGRMVINTVLLETFNRCIDFCKKRGVKFNVIQTHVDRGEDFAETIRLVPINPVMIITIIKQK